MTVHYVPTIGVEQRLPPSAAHLPMLPRTLYARMSENGDRYVGELPSQFIQQLGLSEQAALQRLDAFAGSVHHVFRNGSNGLNPLTGVSKRLMQHEGLADAVRRFFCLEGFVHNGTVLNVHWQPMADQVQVNRLAHQGRPPKTADLFELLVGEKSYVLKIYRDYMLRGPLQVSHEGPFGAAANGSFFTRHQTRDVVTHYASNPWQGWELLEYVGPHTNLSQRTGPSVSDLGLKMLDATPRNYVNGIRVDLGGKVIPLVRKGLKKGVASIIRGV